MSQETQAVEATEVNAFEEMVVAAAEAETEGTVEVPKGEEQDKEKELTPEQKAKQSARFRKAILAEKITKVEERDITFKNRKGDKKVEVNVYEQEATLYELVAQPDEPQYTAMATQSRGGSKKSSDEVM